MTCWSASAILRWPTISTIAPSCGGAPWKAARKYRPASGKRLRHSARRWRRSTAPGSASAGVRRAAETFFAGTDETRPEPAHSRLQEFPDALLRHANTQILFVKSASRAAEPVLNGWPCLIGFRAGERGVHL